MIHDNDDANRLKVARTGLGFKYRGCKTLQSLCVFGLLSRVIAASVDVTTVVEKNRRTHETAFAMKNDFFIHVERSFFCRRVCCCRLFFSCKKKLSYLHIFSASGLAISQFSNRLKLLKFLLFFHLVNKSLLKIIIASVKLFSFPLRMQNLYVRTQQVVR